MRTTPAALARSLALRAEAVCRHYLPNGRRSGRYWLVGDVHGSPGRSLYVRLEGRDHRPGAAGHWTDAATAEHGDLLDLIAANRDLRSFAEVRREAERFLGLTPLLGTQRPASHRGHGGESARRLFAAGRPIAGTLAETYLRHRRISGALDWTALRFHPAVWYREERSPLRRAAPALLAAVTDASGAVTGVHRTWLDPSGQAKAAMSEPRRSLGHLLGNGVRFGDVTDVLIAGEGLETMLSLASVLPGLPMLAALSANHLAAIAFPAGLGRLYVAQDADPAGHRAAQRLRLRCHADGIAFQPLHSVYDDFNSDLCLLGERGVRAHVAAQLLPIDAAQPDRRQPSHFCAD